jgi:ADP-ribosyl-[dinitrogen reductase] hydrolase
MNLKNQDFEKIKSTLFGVAVGDAVGVPFEFSSREQMELLSATDMIGYGTYNQPSGTWSDDSSLTFCLAEAIITKGIDLSTIALNFYKWKKLAWWSARNQVFDIGITTYNSISKLHCILETSEDHKELYDLKLSGDEFDNGNGSLMRISPLLFCIKGIPSVKQFEIIWNVSALTHRHIRAAMSCFIYLKLAENILNGLDKESAYFQMRTDVLSLWEEIKFPIEEKQHFRKIIQHDIRVTKIENLKSGGYVIEVLESSIWFLLNKRSYKETVLSIINLGHDTDTSAAITGGLAGLYYGFDGIPEEWINQIARKNDIVDLALRLSSKIAQL